jgi:hypothetical protein
MEHINMKKCLNCGYERQPKDEGIVPPTECPRCGILYGKIKDEDGGLKDAAGQKHKEGKEFQKDSGTFGDEKESLPEESKSFPIPKISIIRSSLIPFLPTLSVIIMTVLQIMRSPQIDPSLLIPVFFVTIIWLPFLRRPYEIALVHKQLTFKAPVRTVKVNVGDLNSVKDRCGGFFIRFKPFTSINQSVDVINISEWDELIKIIKSINPAVEIKRYSKVGRMIGMWIYPVLMTLLFCFFVLFGYWERNNQAKVKTDFAPVIEALEKYKTANNRYPEKDKLEALTPTYLDTLPSCPGSNKPGATYYFVTHSGGSMLGCRFYLSPYLYSSDTKKWKNEY